MVPRPSPRFAVASPRLLALLAMLVVLVPSLTTAAHARSSATAGKHVRAKSAGPRAHAARVLRGKARRHVPRRLRALSIATRTAFASAKKPRPSSGTAPTGTTGTPSTPLHFGIYPGGGAGTVGPSGFTRPEDPAKRLAALKTLRGTKAFVLHLYEDYRQPADADAIPAWLQTQVSEATANGFEVEMVLRYRPAASGGDVAGYTNFVRQRVRQYGTDPGVTALQITNEANITGAPDAADGAYPAVREALVKGVIAADAEARAAGISHQQIGFNWAYGTSTQERAFFSDLGRLGGSAFTAATDWVGIDAYPGTWGPDLASGDLASAVRAATIDAMRRLRTDLLPAAALPAAAIRFAENGYPTDDAQRTEADQVTVMSAAIQAIQESRGTYGVTDYRWFDLRDADTSAASFESHYGITRDDYSPKAGFTRLRDLVAQLG